MREPTQLQFDFMQDLPVPGADPALEPVDPIKTLAFFVTLLEAVTVHYVTERQAARRAFGLAA